MKILYQFALVCTVALIGCATSSVTGASMSIEQSNYGQLPDGTPVQLYKLTNTQGASAEVITYGGYVVSLKVPDREGKMGDVVLGYDSLEGYLNDGMFLGSIIGRFGNRIGGAKFSLDGNTYNLPANNGANTLHSGPGGFHTVVWEGEPVRTNEGPAVKLSYLSKDGEMGFPGNLDVTCLITLTNDNALKFKFEATTDKPTVCNLTNHCYFNLDFKGDILDHKLTVNADFTTPQDENQVPTGEIRPVAGTPFDFTTPRTVGERIEADDPQIVYGGGYDHNWVLNKPEPDTLSLAARVTEANSGRVLEVFTTAPGVQIYAGNFMDGSVGHGGFKMDRRHGICLEPQHFPDSPNIAHFPSTTLLPGETYNHTMMYKFSTQ